MQFFFGVCRRQGAEFFVFTENNEILAPDQYLCADSPHSGLQVEWGDEGHGSARLALALAYHVLGDEDRARRVYQGLLRRVVARMPHECWMLSERQIKDVIDDIEAGDDVGDLDAR